MSKSNGGTKVTINWNDQMWKLKEKFSILTDKDLRFEQGKLDEMVSRIQMKVGKTRHEIYQLITKI
jgi:uncharacterized protein YjbJ (UPF0337 family)